MYIINTKQKDYYDGVVGTMGIDKGIVYERNTVVIDGTDKNLVFPKEYGDSGRWMHVNPFRDLSRYNVKPECEFDDFTAFIVGFCGQHYVGWKFYKNSDDKNNYYDFTTEITYDYNKVKERVRIESYLTTLTDSLADVLMFDPIEVFRRYHTPIFVFDEAPKPHRFNNRYEHGRAEFIINPMLKDYEFYKKFDSFAAFQEIQMFLSGVLGNKENEIIVISDKDKITQHGFNKFSFRKDKEIKK
jgi:hypothetical protein